MPAEKTKPKQAVKHTSIYAIGNISRQLVGFLMLPIYTRYLTPEDYGVVGLLTLTISLIEIVMGVRLFQAISKFYYEQSDDYHRKAVISGALIITGSVSLISCLLFFLFRDYSSQLLFGDISYGVIVGIFSIQIITNAIENYALFYIRIQERPYLFISVNLVKLVVQLTLNIVFVVWMELGVLGIAYSTGISSVLFALCLGLYTLRITGLKYKWSIIKPMVIFSWPLWLTGLAALYVSSSNRYFLRLFGDLADVGLFELAAKFGAILTLLIWQPFAQYWQTERFKIFNNGVEKNTYNDVFQIISTLMIVATVGISIFSQPVINIMSSSEFHPAALAVPFLVFACLFSTLTAFSNFSFLASDNTKWIAKLQYAMAIIVTVLFLLLIPSLGFIGAAMAAAIAELSRYIATQIISQRHYNMNLNLVPTTAMILLASFMVISCFNFLPTDYSLLASILWQCLIFITFAILAIGIQLLNPRHRLFLLSWYNRDK